MNSKYVKFFFLGLIIAFFALGNFESFIALSLFFFFFFESYFLLALAIVFDFLFAINFYIYDGKLLFLSPVAYFVMLFSRVLRQKFLRV